MTIAELFINLGVKGNEKAVKATEGVKSSLSGVASEGLAAKAAIIGVMYGLERLMAQSGKTGTSLTQFSAFTGISAETLQRWQYAARQAGESSDELTGNIKAVQGSMTAMLTGHGAPEGMAMLANKVGFDSTKARDTMYVMQKLQEYANATKDTPDLANRVMGSFGLSEGTIASMRRNAFNADTLGKAPIYSDKEASQLNKVDVAWANLGDNIEKAMGHLTAKHGMSLVKDISGVVGEVFKLLDAFVKLAEKLEVLKWIGEVFKGWGLIFNGISSVVSSLTDKGVNKTIDNAAKGLWQATKGAAGSATTPGNMSNEEVQRMLSPNMNSNGTVKTNNIQLNQNLHFQHDGKDHKRTGDSTKKAVQDALRQMPAQNQGS